MRMAPEGWPFLAIGWGVAALGAWATLRWGGWWWVIESVVLVLAVWLLVFFRNPERTGPRGDRYVIAPGSRLRFSTFSSASRSRHFPFPSWPQSLPAP